VRILTVDDDPGIVRVVGEAFEDAGYGMTVASTGPDGLLDARLNDYDLIVLDVMLPGLDGIEIARRLRAEGVTTPISFLICSALSASSAGWISSWLFIGSFAELRIREAIRVPLVDKAVLSSHAI